MVQTSSTTTNDLVVALKPEPAAVGAARRLLVREGVDADLEHTVCLLASELVTNSVRHSGVGPAGSVGLQVRVRPERVRVEISDPGPGFEPEVRPPTPNDLDRTGGWGLFLVDELTEGWGVERDGLTRVWFEMGIAPEAEAAAA